MRLTKLFAAVLLITTMLIISCNGDNAKDVIVNKWKFTEISGTGTADIPDSIKSILYSTAIMEFKKDGSFESSGGTREGSQKGRYTVSDDGKTIYSTDEGKAVADTISILEISKDKLIVLNKKADVRLTMVPKK